MTAPLTTLPPGESRSRLITWSTPETDMTAIGAVSGLDYLKGLLMNKAVPPIGALMDFVPIAFEHGRAVFEGMPADFHYNPIGTVHGGFAATLLDSALGCAVHTTLQPGFGYTTVELKINYVRPLRSDTGRVTCEGAVIHVGGRVATAEARLKDASGKLYAHGTTTCLIFRV
jgi:uncharacterized protein (TIGR00369 family)